MLTSAKNYFTLFAIASILVLSSTLAVDAQSDTGVKDEKKKKEEAKKDEKKKKEEAKKDEKKKKEEAKKDEKKKKEEAKKDEKSAQAAQNNIGVAKGSSVPGCETNNKCYLPYESKIRVGGKVTWTNKDTAVHTVTSGADATADGTFDSGLFGPEKKFTYTFDKAGTYNYFCMVHPWMKGVVIVS
jgi:plastocyanin